MRPYDWPSLVLKLIVLVGVGCLLYICAAAIRHDWTDATCRQVGYPSGYVDLRFRGFCVGPRHDVPPPPVETPLSEAQGR